MASFLDREAELPILERSRRKLHSTREDWIRLDRSGEPGCCNLIGGDGEVSAFADVRVNQPPRVVSMT